MAGLPSVAVPRPRALKRRGATQWPSAVTLLPQRSIRSQLARAPTRPAITPLRLAPPHGLPELAPQHWAVTQRRAPLLMRPIRLRWPGNPWWPLRQPLVLQSDVAQPRAAHSVLRKAMASFPAQRVRTLRSAPAARQPTARRPPVAQSQLVAGKRQPEMARSPSATRMRPPAPAPLRWGPTTLRAALAQSRSVTLIRRPDKVLWHSATRTQRRALRRQPSVTLLRHPPPTAPQLVTAPRHLYKTTALRLVQARLQLRQPTNQPRAAALPLVRLLPHPLQMRWPSVSARSPRLKAQPQLGSKQQLRVPKPPRWGLAHWPREAARQLWVRLRPVLRLHRLLLVKVPLQT